MKKLILLCSALMFVAAIAVTASVMTQSENDALLKANLEALTHDEDDHTGYAHVVDANNTCQIIYNGETTTGLFAKCHANEGHLNSCAEGCITSADLH